MRALLVVDMQNDFMPGGSLGVPNADQLVPLINQLMGQFPLVIATQDWHPDDHMSFAESHPGKKVGDLVMVQGIEQILWPVHCVRNTHGSELVPALKKDSIAALFYKGTDKWIDSYSAFFDNARKKSTGLSDYLISRQIKEIAIAGVATDYCILYSVLDALDLGFRVLVIEDACRGINLHPRDVENAFATMAAAAASILPSSELIQNKL